MHERKSESEVSWPCPTLSDPMDCSLPDSAIHGIFQARVLEWGAIAFSVHPSYLLGIKGIAFLWWNQDRDRKIPKWYPQVWKWAWLYLSLIQRISLFREKGGPSKYLCGLLMLEGDVYCHGMRVLTLSLVSLPLSQVYFLFLSRFVFIIAFLCPGTFIYLPSHADLGRSTLN